MSQYYNPQRTRNFYEPNSKDPFKVSRSKIDLFIENQAQGRCSKWVVIYTVSFAIFDIDPVTIRHHQKRIWSGVFKPHFTRFDDVKNTVGNPSAWADLGELAFH